jgi:hypothetical protein
MIMSSNFRQNVVGAGNFCRQQEISLSLLFLPCGFSLQTVAKNRVKIHRMGEKTFVGLTGLATDAQTMYAVPTILSS